MLVVSIAVRAGKHSFMGTYILSGTQPQPWYQFCRTWKGKVPRHFVATICIYHLLPHFGLHLIRKGKREGEKRRLKYQGMDG